MGRNRKADGIGYIVVFVVSGTQEEKWIQSATEGLKSDFIYCPDINSFLRKIENLPV